MSDSGLAEFPRSDDLTLYEGMREAARLNLPVSVHAESEEITRGLTRRMLEAAGRSVRDYLESRPVIAEIEAIERATLMARETGAKLHIVHISSGRGIAAALEARARGTDVSIETCPHYLTFTGEDMERIGAVAKCAPPLRDAAERDRLWEAVRNGSVDIIGSDHSPAPPEMKQSDNFFRIWGGIAGIQRDSAVARGTSAAGSHCGACSGRIRRAAFVSHAKGKLPWGSMRISRWSISIEASSWIARCCCNGIRSVLISGGDSRVGWCIRFCAGTFLPRDAGD